MLSIFCGKKWLGFRKELNQETPWLLEEKFREILMNQYVKNLKKLAKGKIPYLAMEGMNGKNWRKELYCDYKAQKLRIVICMRYSNIYLMNFCQNFWLKTKNLI